MPDGKLNVTHQKLKTPYTARAGGPPLHGAVHEQLCAYPAFHPRQSHGCRCVARKNEPALCLWRWGYCRSPGIAFLWFIGVVRDHLGLWRTSSLPPCSLAAACCFWPWLFVSAALAGGILATYALEQFFIDSGMYTLTRAVLYRITNVYAVKMAGVFMISLATIWVRTRLMPRWLAWLTYVLALGLLLSITSSLWVTLIFPGWVGVVSGYILVTNLRSPSSTL